LYLIYLLLSAETSTVLQTSDRLGDPQRRSVEVPVLPAIHRLARGEPWAPSSPTGRERDVTVMRLAPHGTLLQHV